MASNVEMCWLPSESLRLQFFGCIHYFINRAGKNLSAVQRRKLTKAKDELRKVFHKDAA